MIPITSALLLAAAMETRSVGAGENVAGASGFAVHLASGKHVKASLRKLGPNGDIRLGGDQPLLITADQVISLRRVDQGLPATPEKNLIVLTNGDVLTFAPEQLRLTDDLFMLESGKLRRKGGLAVRVPLTFVAVVWFATPAYPLSLSGGRGVRDQSAPQLLRTLQRGNRARDLVLLANGDRIEGQVSSISAESCGISAGERKLNLPTAQVAAIAFNSDLRARVQPRKLFLHLTLADGVRLGLASFELEAGAEVITGKTFFGEQVQVPLANIVAIDYRLGAAEYLSDIEPLAYEHTPFLEVSWPLARDENVVGLPLRLEGQTYDKGLGMHTTASVRYALNGGYRAFETVVGIDAGARFGSARVRVLVDGKETPLPDEGKVVAGGPPLVLRVELRNAKELNLRAEFLDFGDVQGHVNWAEARLIK